MRFIIVIHADLDGDDPEILPAAAEWMAGAALVQVQDPDYRAMREDGLDTAGLDVSDVRVEVK